MILLNKSHNSDLCRSSDMHVEIEITPKTAERFTDLDTGYQLVIYEQLGLVLDRFG